MLHRPALAVVLVFGTLLVAILVGIRPWSRGTEARARAVDRYSAPPALGPQLESMAHQIADLVRRVEQLEANRHDVREPLQPQPAADVVQANESMVDLAQRVSHLERRAASPEQRAVPQQLPQPKSRDQATQKAIEADHRMIRDAHLSDADKASAWIDLASQEVYPWTDDIIIEMTSIGLTSKDNRAREEVWIGAESQFRSELLVPPLISALADPIAEVREEAADALSQYLDAPGVQSALSWTSNYDESETVREEAAKALRGEE